SITSSENLFVKTCTSFENQACSREELPLNSHQRILRILFPGHHNFRNPKMTDLLTFPGRGGMVTIELSISMMSRKYSKSEYLRRTIEVRNLKAGMLVRV